VDWHLYLHQTEQQHKSGKGKLNSEEDLMKGSSQK
jgi:hypothetical protein